MQTITIDILNEKVLELLKKLEELNLVKVQKSSLSENRNSKKASTYKGILSKKLGFEIQEHIKQSRAEW
jgi:hypothetical protein